MHASSLENLQRCLSRYISADFPVSRGTARVLELGASDVNGSYRNLFNRDSFEYLGADIEKADGVDIVLDNPYEIPLDDRSVDIVISGQMLEHCEFFWLMFAEMIRVLKEDGYLFLIVPSSGPIHRYPVDCYRFYPDALKALAKYSNSFLVESWHDDRGPWNDLVGVFSRQQRDPPSANSFSLARDEEEIRLSTRNRYNSALPESEALRGETGYLEILRHIHECLDPACYLEIGVRNGNSLKLANNAAIGIDPGMKLADELPDRFRLYGESSDEFFEYDAERALSDTGIDMAFIDGMHLFEFALRDFINIERWSKHSTLVVIDDIYPNHPLQASRKRGTTAWTGDIWKFHDCLKQFRPDLVLLPLDTHPTGLLLVAGLDSGNRVLRNRYNPIVRKYDQDNLSAPPAGGTRKKGQPAAGQGID